jgi:hypothetical protein
VWGDFSTLLLVDPDQEDEFHLAMRILLAISFVLAVTLLVADGILETL